MANLDGLAVEFREIVVRRNSRNVDKCVASVRQVCRWGRSEGVGICTYPFAIPVCHSPGPSRIDYLEAHSHTNA